MMFIKVKSIKYQFYVTFLEIFLWDIFGVKCVEKKKWMNYILLWTSASVVPFKNLGEGQNTFIRNRCPFKNCFVTDKRGYFSNIKKFDIIMFNALNIHSYYSLPETRHPDQKYVFAGSMPSSDYPITSNYEGVFNWTWTYKLDSDIPFLYIVVRNKMGEVVGPKRDMQWLHPNQMRPANKTVKWHLRNKKVAIAWIRTECFAVSEREEFALQLKKELALYELRMDTFGRCGDLQCSGDGSDGCESMIQKDYYFYLALEDAMSKDYVSDNVLLGLNNFAVPVVYGAANYSRFLPNGSYLNGYELGVAEVVRLINQAILDKKVYYKYFKWHGYYSFHRPDENEYTDNYCTLCTVINDVTKRAQKTVYMNLEEWWNSPMQQNPKPIYVPVVQIVKHMKKNKTARSYKSSREHHIHRYSNALVAIPDGGKNNLDSVIDPDCYKNLNENYNYDDIDPKVKPYLCKFHKRRWKKRETTTASMKTYAIEY